MRDKLFNIFPEFELIHDESLRDKALSVWEEAIQRGGWTVEDLEHIPFTLLIPNCTVNIVAHTRSVTRVSLEAAKILEQHNCGAYKIDYDLLVCGGLLHDVGKILEYEKTASGVVKSRCGKLLRHPFSGAGLAMKHGLPDEVVHMIAVHAMEGDGGYRCPEAVIVHHADFMNFEPIKLGPVD
ncbi:HDIG domain-containing protein [candidate division KSB1 bacterium]|nr:HDIG domain-containing protein [candidate division KSB1 bacterium]